LGSCGGCDDIDIFLLGEDWHLILAYDSDGHFCVDKDYDDAAGDAEAGDAEAGDAEAGDAEAGDASTNSYN